MVARFVLRRNKGEGRRRGPRNDEVRAGWPFEGACADHMSGEILANKLADKRPPKTLFLGSLILRIISANL